MKIKLDIDCTPEEARAFMGLPDVRPLQDEMMGLLRDRMMKAAQAMDPEALLRTWMPGGAQGFEALQKAFWDALSGGKPKS